MRPRADTAPLQGPYAAPPRPDALRPSDATLDLVRTQVRALLTASPAFLALPAPQQRSLARDVVKIAAYSAELVRDAWWQAERLGQRPLVRTRNVVRTPIARQQAAADDFAPVATGQVARVTQETLRAIAFPTFVADLVRGTFNAIVDASIRQMEAYGRLIANVGKTVDQFMADNISDAQARAWLQETYPQHVRIRNGRVEPAPEADDREPPRWRDELALPGDVPLDADSIEEVVVPAARRRLAESRLQLLSTMVMMGVNRIVVTSGRIRATMGFHIDASDRARAAEATLLDTRAGLSASLGFGPWSASASASFTYVRSTRSDSNAELNVNADLTGEVDIRFESDYFPLRRFVGRDGIERIRANTAVPEENEPSQDAGPPPPPPSRTRAPLPEPSLVAPPAPAPPAAPPAPARDATPKPAPEPEPAKTTPEAGPTPPSPPEPTTTVPPAPTEAPTP